MCIQNSCTTKLLDSIIVYVDLEYSHRFLVLAVEILFNIKLIFPQSEDCYNSANLPCDLIDLKSAVSIYLAVKSLILTRETHLCTHFLLYLYSVFIMVWGLRC